MSWMNLFSALLGALIGAVATGFIQLWIARRRAAEKAQFELYMMLLELKGIHFWIVSSEIHGERGPTEIIVRFSQLRWRIADKLREINNMPEAEEILTTMFSLRFETEQQRSQALTRVIDHLGERINPRYVQIMKRISEENSDALEKDPDEYLRRLKKVQYP